MPETQQKSKVKLSKLPMSKRDAGQDYPGFLRRRRRDKKRIQARYTVPGSQRWTGGVTPQCPCGDSQGSVPRKEGGCKVTVVLCFLCVYRLQTLQFWNLGQVIP